MGDIRGWDCAAEADPPLLYNCTLGRHEVLLEGPLCGGYRGRDCAAEVGPPLRQNKRTRPGSRGVLKGRIFFLIVRIYKTTGFFSRAKGSALQNNETI